MTGLIIALVMVLFFLLYPKKYTDAIMAYSKEYGVSTELVLGVCRCESGFNERAKSNKGAIGVMQLMPSTAKWCCEKMGIEFDEEKLYDANYNIRIGTYYLSYLFTVFDSEEEVLQAYNAGEGNVRKWKKGQGKIFKETEQYVKRVSFAKKVYRLKI